MPKFKDYLKSLQEIAEEYPESLEFEVIYSHDDEGNEFQKVSTKPVICQIENPNYYRHLELVGYLGDEIIDLRDCNAILIN